MKFHLFFTLLFLPILSQAQVYKWVDENGKVHYSDKPMNKNAVAVELKEPTNMGIVKPLPKKTPKEPVKKQVAASTDDPCGTGLSSSEMNIVQSYVNKVMDLFDARLNTLDQSEKQNLNQPIDKNKKPIKTERPCASDLLKSK